MELLKDTEIIMNIFNTHRKAVQILLCVRKVFQPLGVFVFTNLSDRVKCMWFREGILERQGKHKIFWAWISTE